MKGRNFQEAVFHKIYQELNEQQRLAVDTIEGPVMVIAGPGTGKTQILSARIGKILLDTDAGPENILCLTYTEAGVVAMRKRLQQFIGADAYKVTISTFHAFCNDVIQENLPMFRKHEIEPVSELERIGIMRELINAFPANHPLKRYRGDVYYEINNLQSLFSAMKREGWTPHFINAAIDAYLADLPNRDGFVAKRATKQFKKGDLRTDKIEEETEKMNKLRAAVQEFENYRNLMNQHKRYDFDDMINWVIDAFKTNQNLLLRYQEQYLYILVDEYQDTSGTQNKIVELLINYWDKPNVFVVGDDDQSIYRFQGANVENMLGFVNSFQDDLVKVVLTNNYRSTQPILDVSKTLIGNNKKRLIGELEGLTKDLVASNTRINMLQHLPIIREYETRRQEMIGITRHLQELLHQGIKPGRIAVIYKENKYGEDLSVYCKLLNIPVYSKRNLNLLDQPLAQKIILVLRFLAAEHDTPYGGDEMLFELLHFDWFGISPIEIAKLSIEVAERQFGDNKTSLRRLLFEKATRPPADLFAQGLPQAMKNASLLLEKLIAAVPNVTLQVLFETIVREAGILSAIMKSPEKHWLLEVLTGLFDFIKEETRRKPTLQLQELVSTLELMEKEGIVLPLVRVSGSDKGVNLLTAHGSKGLEFEYVFIAGCNATYWEKKRKPGGGYTFPDTMFASVSDDADQEELRRLFYVALTRAEQHLFISYSRFKDDGRESEPSMFLAEIQHKHQLKTEQQFIDADTLASFQVLEFTEQIPEIAQLEEEFVNRLLDKFVMNVTALNNYLKCPLEFYYRNLVRIPSPKNEATEFGSSVHFALEQLFKKMMEHPAKQFPPKEQFIEDFEWYMHRHRESFTQEQFDRRLEYGQKVLSGYYDEKNNTWNKVVAIERTIRNVVVNGVPLKGKLDKLEFDGKAVNVVDYKTGDPEKAKTKLVTPGEKEPNGGDYWRQAVFYKILVDHYEGKGWQAVSTEFDFIEPDKKNKYQKHKLVIEPPDIETVKQQIVDVWEKIQQKQFYTGCGKEDCHWCNFVKTNNLAVALHSIDDGETGE